MVENASCSPMQEVKCIGLAKGDGLENGGSALYHYQGNLRNAITLMSLSNLSLVPI